MNDDKTEEKFQISGFYQRNTQVEIKLFLLLRVNEK